MTRNTVGLFLGMALVLPSWSQVIGTVGGSNAWGGPLGVKLDPQGNIYVADWAGHAVYKIDSHANITTVAGKPGFGGNSGDGNQATSALLVGPAAAVVDKSGNVYIADYSDSRIRKVSPSGIITTLVGSHAGFADGPSGSALVNGPLDLALDSAGNLYVVDSFNYRIRKITPNGTVSTFAGTGRKNSGGDGGQALATDMIPTAIAFGPDGSLYYTDAGFRTDPVAPKVRRIAPNGVITTVAGNGKIAFAGDGQAATSASFVSVDGVAVDPSGNVFVAEYNGNRVRKVDASTGIITTYAGTGVPGLAGDGGAANQALLWGPVGLQADAQGSLYICEYINKRVRKVSLPNIPTIPAANSGVPSFSGQTGFSSNMYMDITGTNLAQTTRTWTAADFNGSLAPTSLDGVSVTVNGNPAFIRYVSPGQIGIIAPDDTATGPVTIQVQGPTGLSNVGSVTRAALSPTLQTNPQAAFGGNQYVLAQTPDFKYFAGSPSIIAGLPFSAPRPGDTVVIYALGCGPIDPPTPAGTITSQDSALTLQFTLNIGGVPAGIVSAIAPANTIGLYQFTITIPAVPPGDQPIELIVNGVSNAQGLLITVGQ
ncbi:MAG TPA: hypothetical protein VEV17_03990 [Bryobacteraceae bacterium]|nr:hypothetical protein [Bryobacteraceae bacterium]